jgi:hypothetical protein
MEYSKRGSVGCTMILRQKGANVVAGTPLMFREMLNWCWLDLRIDPLEQRGVLTFQRNQKLHQFWSTCEAPICLLETASNCLTVDWSWYWVHTLFLLLKEECSRNISNPSTGLCSFWMLLAQSHITSRLAIDIFTWKFDTNTGGNW